MSGIGVKRILILEIIFMKRKGILELLCQVLVDRFATLKNRSTILETLNLFHDETNRIDFVLLGPVYGDDTLPILLLFIRQNFDHSSS